VIKITTPGRLVGLVFLLLLPCFGLWTLLAPALVKPAIGFVHLLLSNWMPTTVASVQVDGSQALIMTQFGELQGKLVSARAAGHAIALPVNTNILSYSIPFYTALMLATPGDNKMNLYGQGLIWLYLVLVLSLVFLCLKVLMTNLGIHFSNQGSLLQPPNNLIALVYQLATLILPVLIPVVLWLYQCRNTPLLQTLLAPLADRQSAVTENGKPDESG